MWCGTLRLRILSKWAFLASGVWKRRTKNFTRVPILPTVIVCCSVASRAGCRLPFASSFADRLIGIPMPTGAVRSLNLATAVGIVLYDALRRLHGW